MDNIFDGSSDRRGRHPGPGGVEHARVQPVLQQRDQRRRHDHRGDFPGNAGAVFGNPEFVDPTADDFGLEPNSAAIDAARSEIGPSPVPTRSIPRSSSSLSDLYGTRTNPDTLCSIRNSPELPTSLADSAISPIRARSSPCRDPESFSFQDEWVPGADDSPRRSNSYGGPSTGTAAIAGTYNYTPINGQRDALGLIRIDDPSVPNVGYGKYPFFDIGAYEYVNLYPPEVTGVTATISAGSTPVNFYAVGGKSGANQTPQYIDVTFNSPIDPTTLNASTVELEALGVTGNNVPGTLISLAGKISYDQRRPTHWSSAWAPAG